MKTILCPFCTREESDFLASNDVAVAFFDSFPVSQGHALIVPRRHVVSVFELASNEADGLWRLLAAVREQIARQFAADDFNIGVNDGAAAGQTVSHAHIHVIPRRAGDTDDPRGGVRWVLPAQADYWTKR